VKKRILTSELVSEAHMSSEEFCDPDLSLFLFSCPQLLALLGTELGNPGCNSWVGLVGGCFSGLMRRWRLQRAWWGAGIKTIIPSSEGTLQIPATSEDRILSRELIGLLKYVSLCNITEILYLIEDPLVHVDMASDEPHGSDYFLVGAGKQGKLRCIEEVK